ncbi:MAG: tetratricopeptide repeat protein [Chloroflexota bacterium]|nr:tetratricopeptide repeat protein [Chloroflexota bacterium]
MSLKYFEVLVVTSSLAAIVAVPLAMPAFQEHLGYAYAEYKTFALHLTAVLVATGLLLEVVVRSANGREDGFSLPVMPKLTRHDPVSIVVAGMIALLVAQAISTALSPLPRVSFFGVYEEFNGFNLYDSISLFVLFVGVTLKFRSRARLRLLITALVVGGSLTAAYGLSQHFGWDEFGGRQENALIPSTARIPSSFGNTLNFAAFLVLTIPLTLSLAVLGRSSKLKLLPVIMLLLGLQLAALWLAGGRGPYIGAATGILFLLAAIAAGLGRTAFAKSVAVVLGATIITFVIAVSPSPTSVDGASRLRSIGDEIGSLAGENVDVGASGLKARSEIWRTALSLTVNPKVPQEEPQLKTLLRPVYGLGPDMFVHSYPLAVSPRSGIELQVNAHNLPLHIFVSTGLFGLISLTIIFTGLILIVKRLFSGIRTQVSGEPLTLMLPSVFTAALVGKSIEMQTGLARVSDLTPAVVILGALLAGYSLTLRADLPVARSKSFLLDTGSKLIPACRLMTIGLAVTGIILFVSIFSAWDMRRIGATAVLADSSNLTSPDEAGQSYLEAHRRAPNRKRVVYTLYESYFTTSARVYADGRQELAHSLLLSARELWLDSEKRNPYELGAQLALAKIASTMVERGHFEFSSELLERYSRIAENNPGFPTLTGAAATAAASIGEYELAIEFANNAINTESRTHGWSKAWFARGISRFLLGFEDEGISDLIVATKKQPGTEGARLAHLALAKIYRDDGEPEQADLHNKMAIE